MEESIDVTVSRVMGDRTKLLKLIPQDCMQRRKLDLPVPQIQEEKRSGLLSASFEQIVDVWLRSSLVLRLQRRTVSGAESAHLPLPQPHQAPAVQDAEECPDEHEANEVTIETGNGLENCCVSVRNTQGEEKLVGKF